MMTVRFLHRFDRYNADEKAGFPEEEARRLIDRHVAEPVIKPVEPQSNAAAVSRRQTRKKHASPIVTK